MPAIANGMPVEIFRDRGILKIDTADFHARRGALHINDAALALEAALEKRATLAASIAFQRRRRLAFLSF